LQQSESQIHWLWVPYPLAGLLIIGIIVLGIHSVKSVHHLKLSAEDAGEDDEQNEPDHKETK